MLLHSNIKLGFSLAYQPFVLHNTVNRNKRNNDGHFADILLIFRTVAVILILPQFEPSGTAEHYPKNQRISPVSTHIP